MFFLIKSKKYPFPIRTNPLKSAFDFFFSLIILILLSPFFAIIAIAITIDSPGPVFYVSERLGRGGKIIRCWKFRTMHINAEQRLFSLLEANPKYKAEWTKFQKLKKDPRITKIGNYLRKTSLDELPQFFNVIKGDLSIVGPRPFTLTGPKENFLSELKSYLGEKTEKILSIRPGITGLWQVSGRSNISIKERVQLDEEYIDTHSFIKDFYFIIKTIAFVFFPKGAY